ncbi:hydroxymethylglutaryl-CoA synthase [Haloferax mucosum ATCC BAA-1512]|uniref:Hydroxymethylglutaryl-CoA synthase n=1 Tax=Haloferax mucosum ATCC BAA-1512 TaxID=662479 RepID=M0IMX6_9EURY|nr:zinc ribbon domain-containing protein [Haloferax mucosum]ELZ98161.1 hydroxymethylglutaryl-CoA synthase [Haloferax mucosum ATCC BAA-1512]
MSRLGIAGIGAYVPRLYVPASAYRDAWGTGGAAGVERVAVADADEDVLTMATEASQRALDAADGDASDVEHLALATTTPPTDEEEHTVRLASLLGIDPAVPTRQFGGGTRAGAVALAATLDATGPALVAVADSPQGTPESDESAGAGAGAAALVLTEDGVVSVEGVGEYGEPFPGTRFRRRGSADTESIGITQYERDAYTSAVGGAVEALEDDVSATSTAGAAKRADAVALTAPDGALPYRAARTLGVTTEKIAAGTVVSQTGDTGSAGPFLGLASALESGVSSVLLVGYGGGAGATAAFLSAESDVPVDAVLDGDTALSYAEALRRRGTITGEEPEGGGAYVSVPTWRQTIPQRHRLVAGRCVECGALSFPPEGACFDCGSLDGYENAVLPGSGTVEAATAIGQGGAPPEFVEQQQRSGSFPVAVVAFDGPGDDESVSAPAQVVHSPAGTPVIGDRVEAVPRRIYEQEGVVRYGFKVVPTEARR